jgi:hypothetical protein
MVERYGAAAVFGNRQLTAREVMGMNWSSRIIEFYNARTRSESWAKWAQDNPDANDLLNWAGKVANEQS